MAAAALGRLAARTLGSGGGGSALRRTAALPRSTHTKAFAIGKEGDMRRIQEKEELYDLMLEAERKHGIENLCTSSRSCSSYARLLGQLSAHVTRDDADWANLRKVHRAYSFTAETGFVVCCAGLIAGSTVAVANAVVWLSYGCSSV